MAIDIPEGVEISPEELQELQGYISEDGAETLEDGEFDEPNADQTMIVERMKQVIVVAGLPVIDEAKVEKLQRVLNKIYGQFSEVHELKMPLENGKTLGFAFVVLDNAEAAASAIANTNNFPLDKKHTFEVFPYSDLDKYGNWPLKYVAPETRDFVEPPNFYSWLEDGAGRDQFVTRQDKNTEIYWCEGIQMGGESSLVYGGEREKKGGKVWCNGYTQWSPKGTYLATFHDQGIALWGGPEFRKIMRFSHSNVQFLSFSPNEEFLITWNGRDDGSDPRSLIVWSVKTGREMRAFVVHQGSQWPVMKWSATSQFFARGIKDGISVFDVSTMKQLNGKPVKAKGIQSFDWSPSDNIIAYWTPEVDNMPARVALLDPTKGKPVRSKNLFNVSDVKLYWQDAGDFLCAQVLRHTKSKKTTFTNLEVFRMRDPNIPNEMIEVKERVEHFSWEPKRERFGVIHGESQHRLNISFYTMDSIVGGEKMELLYTLEQKQANVLHWSPAGNNVVMANTNNINGQIEFWDVDEKLSTAEEEHFMCNQISWDPSGRMLATVVTQPMTGTVAVRYQLENGYNLWSFQGAPLRKHQTQLFYQFSWRPRPESVLTDEEKEDLTKNLKKYTQRFKEADSKRRDIKDAAANAERIEVLTEFRERMAKLKAKFEEECQERYRLGLWSEQQENDYEEVEETFEEVIKESVEPYHG